MAEQSWNKLEIEAAFDDSISDGIRFTPRSKTAFMRALTTPKGIPSWEKDKKALELAVEILEKTKKWYRSIGVGEFDSFVDNTLSDIRKIIE